MQVSLYAAELLATAPGGECWDCLVWCSEQQAGVIIINICTHDGRPEETKTDIFHEKFDVIRQINKFSPRAHDQQLVAARHRARDI